MRYVVAYDGSPSSRNALAWAARRARAEGARIVLATVIPESIANSFFSQMLLPTLDLSGVVPAGTFEKNADRRLQEAAKETGLPADRVETRVLKGEAWDALVKEAAREATEALVLGGKSYEKVAQFELGATAERVVRHASCSVVVVR